MLPPTLPIPSEAVLYAASFTPAALATMLRDDLDFRYSETADTTVGVLLARSMSDDAVLEAARDSRSDAYRWIADRMGPDTNRSWITARMADVAYDRGLITGPEHDRITF